MIVAFGDNSQHERIIAVLLKDLLFEFNDDIDLFYRAREESGFSEGNVSSVDVNEVLSFCEFCGGLLLLFSLDWLYFFLRR